MPHVFQANEFNANTWVDEKEVPYTCPPASPYNWVRVRLFGGRSLFWSRQSFRLSDYEFKAKSHDGFGDDWPISLADLAPYYSRVEEIFRVEGVPVRDAAVSGRQLRTAGRALVRCDGPLSRRRQAAGRTSMPAAPIHRHQWPRQLHQSAAAGCLRNGKAAGHPECRRARAARESSNWAGARGAFCRPHLAPGDVDQSARGGAGGGNARKHSPTAELEDRQLKRRDGPLPDRSDLRRGHRLLRARGARRQGARAS